jgi:hypothetical protein
MALERVFAYCQVDAVLDQPQNAPLGKAYIRCTFKDEQGQPVIICMTTNLAEMVGGLAKGVNELYNSKITWLEPKGG